MDSILLAEWEDRAEQGLFRYDVTACPTQLVPGTYGFIAQCNEGRASKKRATEFRVDQVGSCHAGCCIADHVQTFTSPDHHAQLNNFVPSSITCTSVLVKVSM